MAWTNKDILATVELLIYLLLLLPFAYSAYKHGKAGIFTHVYLFLFMTLRIIYDGLTISDRNKGSSVGSGSATVNSIGLSPLLLAGAALLNMIRLSLKGRKPSNRDKQITLVLEIVLHVAVIGGVAILATGGSKLANAQTDHEVKNAHALQEAGAILLVLVWVALCVWAFFLFRKRHAADLPRPALALRLLIFTILSLPFIGARAIYSLVYSVDHSPKVNPATAGFAVQLVAIFLIQVVAFVIILTGLLLTRDLKTSRTEHQNVERFTSSTLREDSSELHPVK